MPGNSRGTSLENELKFEASGSHLDDVLQVGQAAKVQRLRPVHEQDLDQGHRLLTKSLRGQTFEAEPQQVVVLAQPR